MLTSFTNEYDHKIDKIKTKNIYWFRILIKSMKIELEVNALQLITFWIKIKFNTNYLLYVKLIYI